jgi:3-dehydroquinate dehydratase/shikimate dehydrogenase
MALVCETVTASRLEELRAARDRDPMADLVELRLDGVRDLDVAGALAGRTRSVIVTCRPVWEGGRFDGSEEERLAILGEAIRLGAEYVDVEWRADRSRLPTNERTRIVISTHDFEGVPADLASRVRAMCGQGAPIVKVAVTARRLRDCLAVKRAMAGVDAHVAIAMGTAGQLTRVWPAWFGSRWTYGGRAAPGQLSVRVLVERYRVRRTSVATAGYGIVGCPLAHSASPAMHNAAFAAAGLDAVYVPLETPDPAEALEVADAMAMAGASVTAPLKEALCERVAPAGTLSKALGAVNTLRRGDRGWEGENFDAAAFLEPLAKRGEQLTGRAAVVLGAGGAARAVAWALKTGGARVAVAARRREQAERLAGALGIEVADWPPRPGWDLLVNATPVGTWPDEAAAPIDRDRLTGRLVCDLVYNPRETTLMKWARAAGAAAIGGLEMLVSQACRQFEWWTGRPAPVEAIERAAREFIEGD